MLAGWVCVLIRSDLGELVQAVTQLLRPHMIMVGAELVPFSEVLRHLGASLSFCHLLGPRAIAGAEFLPAAWAGSCRHVGGAGCARAALAS